jgi:hypothetical protein
MLLRKAENPGLNKETPYFSGLRSRDTETRIYVSTEKGLTKQGNSSATFKQQFCHNPAVFGIGEIF